MGIEPPGRRQGGKFNTQGIKRRVRVGGTFKRKIAPLLLPTPESKKRYDFPPGNRPPTPPRSPSPEAVYISDSGTEPEPEGWGSSSDEPMKKKVRFNVNIESSQYERNEHEYKLMHEKDIKEMTKTQMNVKMKYHEFWPPKQKRLLSRLYDQKRKADSKEYALKRLKECIGLHLRVNKLNRGEYEPLSEAEQPLQGITIQHFEKNDDDDFMLNDASTHVAGHLRQTGSYR